MEQPSPSDSQSTGQSLNTHSTYTEPTAWSGYSAETAGVEVVELPRLLLVDLQSLRSIQQRRQYDSFVHLEFGAEVESMSIPDHILHASKGLAGFSDPMGDLIVDFGAA
ncbi:unnamed protein product [Schistocephalus solidus]|uniref:Phosphoribulokinase n=1 Tax=Schistocephalus solidus TaxID=70667 RepID=A0A183SZT9_SCHSO|nr:unnamed protein product [Schistocephalus solidus]